MSAWSRNELPSRAPPLPESLLRAFVGQALLLSAPEVAVGIAIAFDGLMRSGELFKLKCGDCVVADDDKSVVINLGITKGGSRRGVVESVVLYDDLAINLLRARLLRSLPGDALLPKGGAHFRKTFSSICRILCLDDFSFRPYSLRRGGATLRFQRFMSMSSTCVRGRWGQERTARLYIKVGDFDDDYAA